MYEDMGNFILVITPFLSALILCAVLLYGYNKDRDKRKLMFAIGMASAAVGYYNWAAQVLLGAPQMGEAYEWTFLPITAAMPIVAALSLLKRKNYDAPFKIFLLSLGISIIMFSAQLHLEQLRISLMIAFAAIAYPTVAYLIIKVKEASDLIFLLALACFTAEGITRDLAVTSEITALLSLFGVAFTALMFIVPTSSRDSVASFFKLQNQLKQTREELQTAQEKLRKAERLATIGEVASMIGHDLRTPLTGINNAAYYLKRRSNTKLSEEELKMLSTIEKCVERSNNIIKELLEYSKEVTLDLTETNPKLLIEDALSQIAIPASVKIDVQTQNQPTLKIDKEKMARVFINLINNSIEAMQNNGNLAIKSEPAKETVVFSFKDTGMGMTPETLNKIWTPLFTTKTKGMGLGLSICQRIIEAHGGNITVESEVGKGSLFKLKFPLDAAEILRET